MVVDRGEARGVGSIESEGVGRIAGVGGAGNVVIVNRVGGVKGVGESEGMDSEGWGGDSGDEDEEGMEEGMVDNDGQFGGL